MMNFEEGMMWLRYLCYRLVCWANGWQARSYLKWLYYDAWRFR
jgi:hypothetical protein